MKKKLIPTVTPTILTGAQYRILPENLVLSYGYFEDFETTGDWTQLAGTMATNTIEVHHGTQSIKLTSPVGTLGAFHRVLPNWDLSGMVRFSFWLYLHSPITSFSNIGVTLSSNSGNYTKKFEFSGSRSWWDLNAWNLIHLYASDMTATGGELWTNLMNRLRFVVTPVAGQSVSASFDEAYFDIDASPALMIRFDDGWTSAYTEAFDYMRPKRIPGTIYQQTNFLNTDNGYTTSQALEMYNAGWAIGNHSRSGTSLAGLSIEDQQTVIAEGKTDLFTAGMPLYADYFCLPGGSKDSNTYTALANEGVLTCTNGGSARHPCMPPFDIYEIESYSIQNTTPLSTVLGYVDTAITKKESITLAFHKIVETPTLVTEWSISNFHTLIDYIVSKKSQITPITIHDYYRLTSSAVRVRI